MNKEFFEALDMLEKEKGIPKAYMTEKVEAALLSAFKRENGGRTNCVVRIDSEKGTVKLLAQYTVVEAVENPDTELTIEQANAKGKQHEIGDVIEEEVKIKDFGRIAAQAAKQVIIQAIREAERGNMIREYENKKGDIVPAVVIRTDSNTGNVTLEIGKNEMVLFRHDQIPEEQLKVGDRVCVYVTEIKKEQRGPSVVLSRIHPELVRKLFEREVPEIADGVVEIRAIAREAGSRTKIAVMSNDPNVDPIGACIGPAGARKNNVTAELCGEKIDIILYNDNPEQFISASLAPATVISVSRFPDDEHAYRVIVENEQLSLAIGKKGQNARLAARLTGLKIDIKSAVVSE